MAPETMGVDADQLISLASEMLSAAGDIPQAPPPFTTTGTDPLSTKIMSAASALEGPIQTGLPEIKKAASKTASDMGEAGKKYQQVDDELAGRIEQLTGKEPGSGGGGGAGGGAGAGASAGGAAGAGAGGAAGASAGAANAAASGAGGADQLGQLMSTPMQMASQAAQLPSQALGALGSLPQSVMQGVQQVSQMAGGAPKAETPEKANDGEQENREAEEKRKADEKAKAGAGPAQANSERAPVAPRPPVEQPAQAVPEREQPTRTRPRDGGAPISL